MTENSKEIEAEVEARRANVESTLNELRGRATVEGVARDMGRYVGIDDPRASLEAAGREVNANPVAFGLIAVGIACLATGMTRRNTEQTYTSPYDTMNRESVAVSRPGIGTRVKDRVRGYSERASDYAERAHGYASHARTTGTQHVHDASNRVRDFRDQATGHVRDVRDQASDFSHRAVHQVSQQPLLFGLGALVAGAVIGAALPKSQAENRWLGPSHDRLAEGARDMASELSARASAAAEAGLSAASRTAKDEGLVPDDGHTLAERVEHVAESAAKEAGDAFRDPDTKKS